MTGLDVTVPAAVWDEIFATHSTVGSAGAIVKTIKKKATLASIKK
jgi:hypothetical protein